MDRIACWGKVFQSAVLLNLLFNTANSAMFMIYDIFCFNLAPFLFMMLLYSSENGIGNNLAVI